MSLKEGREYLIIIGDRIKDSYKGNQHDVSLEPLQKYYKNQVSAVLHTHPFGPRTPSVQDLIAVDYILWNLDRTVVHGVVSDNTLVLYNYYTIDTPKLNKVFASLLSGELPTEERFNIAHPYVIDINKFDITVLPDVVDHFAIWQMYWKIINHDTFFIEYQDLALYEKFKENSLFVPRGRQEVKFNGTKEANIYWLIPEIDTEVNKAWFYKVYEFTANDQIYKVMLQDYGQSKEVDDIKVEDIIKECKKKKLCRII